MFRKATVLAVFVLVTLALACGGPRQTTSPAASPTNLPSLHVDEFITGLDVPWEMVFTPDGRIFLTERPGKIRTIKDGHLQDQPWLTLDVAATGEGGLLGLAIDPDFTSDRYLYAAYTYRDAAGQLKNRLVRLVEKPDGTGTEDEVLLDNVPGGTNHDGGRVRFGPDGRLYWTMGDAGNAQSAQDKSSLSGKILRLNPDGTIPSDNPFDGSPVYSYGNRNPEGLAWQPGTGRLYATEHGSSAHDEVNFIEAGKNYGWPVITGEQTMSGMETPVIESGSETWAPSGATFAVGGPWDGSFLFTGLRGETLYRLVLDKNDPRKVITLEKYLSGEYGRLRDIVQAPDGTLYLLTNNRDGRGAPRSGDDKILRLTFR